MARTKTILTANLDKLHAMAKLLLEYETIDVPQIDAVMENRASPPPMGWSPGGPARDEPKPFTDRRARPADLIALVCEGASALLMQERGPLRLAVSWLAQLREPETGHCKSALAFVVQVPACSTPPRNSTAPAASSSSIARA